ncbi:MAG: pyridoxamine 5'-phosphate oxidase family protein [Lachnospiraceae bacterium]|nr:pyridoxamine 5'-phosphate oxidase family protein [Lachnospiraceae bacterium]
MSVQLEKKIIEAINDPASVKVIATVSKDGVVHVTPKGSITVDEEGRIRFLELLEKSQTQKNLVYSIWFDKYVAINIITADKKSYLIKGKTLKTVNSGKEFQDEYVAVQKKLGYDIDLSAIWFVDVEEVSEQTFEVRREILETAYPYEKHVDRFAKDEYRFENKEGGIRK